VIRAPDSRSRTPCNIDLNTLETTASLSLPGLVAIGKGSESIWAVAGEPAVLMEIERGHSSYEST
jgi:hypothetical protein